jgi:hypothetical protein
MTIFLRHGTAALWVMPTSVRTSCSTGMSRRKVSDNPGDPHPIVHLPLPILEEKQLAGRPARSARSWWRGRWRRSPTYVDRARRFLTGCAAGAGLAAALREFTASSVGSAQFSVVSIMPLIDTAADAINDAAHTQRHAEFTEVQGGRADCVLVSYRPTSRSSSPLSGESCLFGEFDELGVAASV